MDHLDRSPGSKIAILYEDYAFCAFFAEWLIPLGWTCASQNAADPFEPGDHYPALMLMDGAIDAARRGEIIATLRAMAGPVAGTPILLIARPDAPGQNGTAGRIDTPLHREQVRTVIEQWAGPLEQHAFRDISSPHYRLVRLAGRPNADRLLLSFAEHIVGALARLDAHEDVARTAHNIAGLAGTLGFGVLSRLWSAIERDESPDIDAARTATRAVLDDVKHMISMD